MEMCWYFLQGGDVKLVFISVSTRGGCLLDKEDVELESRGHTLEGTYDMTGWNKR